MNVSETRRRVRTRKREHVDVVKTFNTKRSALSHYVVNFDCRIAMISKYQNHVTCMQAWRCDSMMQQCFRCCVALIACLVSDDI